MAGQADGSIIIDTELKSDGLKADSEELLSAIKSLSAEVKALGQTLKGLFAKPLKPEIDTQDANAEVAALEDKVKELQAAIREMQASSVGGEAAPAVSLGNTPVKSSGIEKEVNAVRNSVEKLEPTFRKAMSGSESAAESFGEKVSAIEDKIAELRERLEAVGNAKFPTGQYQSLVESMDKAAAKADALREKQKTLDARGVSHNSRQWQNLQVDIDRAVERVDQYAEKIRELESSGGAYVAGVDTSQYAQMEQTISAAEARLGEMQDSLRRSDSWASKLGRSLKKAGTWTVSKLASGVRSAASGLAKMFVNTKQINSQFKRMSANAKKFTISLLGAKGIWALLRKAVSAYMSENEELSNTLNRCWISIGNVLGPIITKVINLVAQAVSYLTAFLKLFQTMGSGVSKAIGKASSAASSAADKLKRHVAGFDELNVRSEDKNGNNSTEPLLDAELPDWPKMMVAQLKNGDWAAAATTLTDQLNGMVASADWAGVGTRIGTALNGVLTFLATAILNFDWYSLGVNLGTGINNIIQNVDWANLGVVLGAKFIVLINGLAGLFATLDWAGIGKALADSFMGLWTSIDWARAAQALSDGVIGILTTLTTTIENIDWQQIGRDVATFIGNIDWGGVVSALFEGIGAALGGLAAFLWGLIEDAWNSVVDWWYDNAYEDGEFTIGGLLEGIWNGIKNIGTWIYDHIFKPFIDGFKKVFGIHSPSTVMAEQGGYIVQGLLNGISEAWHSITEFFSGAVDKLKGFLSGAWDKIKDTASTAWTGIKDGISNAWDKIKTTTSNAGSAIAGKASSAWSSVKNFVSDNLTKAKNTAANAWSSMKSTVSSTLSSISSNTASKFSSVYSTINSKVSSIKSTVSRGFDTVKNSMTSKMQSAMSIIKNQGWSGVGSAICDGIGNGINAGWNWLKTTVGNLASNLLNKAKSVLGIHSPSRVFRDEVGLNIGYGIGEGVDASQSSILKSVSGVADAIAEEFNAGDYQIGGVVPTAEVDGSLASFSDKIADSFTTLLDRLQRIADSVTFHIPTVAAGVVPYGVQVTNARQDNDPQRVSPDALQAFSSDVDERLADMSYTLRLLLAAIKALNLNIDIDALADAISQQQRNRLRNFGGA